MNPNLANIVLWVIGGVAVSFAVNVLISGSAKGGILLTTLLGLVGGLLGGFLGLLLLKLSMSEVNFLPILFAMFGAALLVAVQKFLLKDEKLIKTKVNN